MSNRKQRSDPPAAPGRHPTPAVRDEAPNDGENACRCKETAQMKPRELLGLMLKDLAFWKKDGKKRS